MVTWTGLTERRLLFLFHALWSFAVVRTWFHMTRGAYSIPNFQRSEVLGLVAGFGTTFAAMPDLIAMLKRRSSAGMNPRMAAIMGLFQILWVYYGLLIASRPVIVWNVISVLVNFLSVGAYFYFVHKEKSR
jgi:MtN3 and saliva related transmembrane protein